MRYKASIHCSHTIAALLSLVVTTTVVSARTWTVMQGDADKKQRDAASPAQLLQENQLKAGDKILVYPGTYEGGFNVPGNTVWQAVDEKGTPLQPAAGESSSVVIDAAGRPNGVMATLGGVTISGFEFRGASVDGWGTGNGLWILNNGRVTVENCVFRGNERHGIFISNHAHGVVVRRCTFIGGSLVESGGQGVGDNRYEFNTLYDAGIKVPAGNKGSTGRGNRCLTGSLDDSRPNAAYAPELRVDYYPTYGKALVTLDGRNMVVGRRLEKADVSIFGPEGRTVVRFTIKDFTAVVPRGSLIPEERVTYTALARKSLELQDLAEGTYTVVATLWGQEVSGTVSATFERVKLPWEATDLGISDQVLSPWTPIQYDAAKKSVSVWGRRYVFADSGLFEQVRTAGEDILTGPFRLEAQTGEQGKETEVPFTVVSPFAVKAQEAARFSAESALAGQVGKSRLRVFVRSETEYDGFTLFTLRLEPEAPVNLRALRLVIPVQGAFATHLHSAGAAMRQSVWAGRLSGDAGLLWDSTMSRGKIADSARMTVGSFKPYIWLGRAGRGGLAYMADNDRGWIPNDDVPAFEVIRSAANTVHLVFNFISRPAVLDAPRTITFSLQATPVKPLPDDFRAVAGKIDNLCSFVGAQNSYYAGSPYHLTGWDGTVLPDGRRANSPFPVDWWKNKWYNQRLTGEGRIYLPYQTINYTHLADPPHPKLKGPTGQEFWRLMKPEIACDGHGGWCKVPAHINYRLFRYRRWVHENRVRGFYFDNAYPVLCRKLETGCGYRLADGRIQPGYNLFGLRQFFKRLRTVIMNEGLEPCIFTHSTDTFMAPAYSFVDLMMDGENRFIRPDNERYFSEIWPLDHFQTMETPHHWGITTIFIPEFHGDWSGKPEWKRAQWRSYHGYLLLHDVESYYLKHGWRKTLALDKSARFFPYWLPSVNDHLQCRTDNVLTSAYAQEGKLVLVIFNHSREDREAVTVRIHPVGLGRADFSNATEFVNGDDRISVDSEGWATVNVGGLKPHDYAVVPLEYR
ncbi:MAG: right-handed parallel beta-helix repeat-containing protein [Candidatus Pacebacteria bacterium]|nr:right-handed parallel beta-helix repeat-containing protein [Candidatus Paceibacterota bacterium]